MDLAAQNLCLFEIIQNHLHMGKCNRFKTHFKSLKNNKTNKVCLQEKILSEEII